MGVMLYVAVFFPMLSALVSYLLGRKRKELRDRFAFAVTGVEFGFFLWFLGNVLLNGSGKEIAELPGVCGMGLHLTMDGFRALYGTIDRKSVV